MIPAPVPVKAWRNGRFVEEFPFTDLTEGVESPVDFTGYTGAMQVRLYGAAGGAALVSLTNQTTDVEGVWIIEPSQGIVRIRIDEATLTALWTAIGGTAGIEPNEAYRLKYDLILTPPTGGDLVWAEGDFLLYPGVTV